MSRVKVEIEKFHGRNNLWLWSVQIKALLTTQSLAKILKGKEKLLKIMKDAERDVLTRKARSIIMLNLLYEMLIEVAEEKDAATL